MAEVKPDDAQARTYAEIVASNLIEIASSPGRSAVAAASEIADRLEGKARVSLDFADVTADLRARSNEELEHFLANGDWPETQESLPNGDVQGAH